MLVRNDACKNENLEGCYCSPIHLLSNLHVETHCKPLQKWILGGVAYIYIYIDANKRGWAISNEIDWSPVSNISKLTILLGIPIDCLDLALCIASLFQSGGNVQWPSLLCSFWCWQVPHGKLWPAVRVSGSHRCHIQLPDDQSHLTWPSCTLAVVPSSLWSSKMAMETTTIICDIITMISIITALNIIPNNCRWLSGSQKTIWNGIPSHLLMTQRWSRRPRCAKFPKAEVLVLHNAGSLGWKLKGLDQAAAKGWRIF